MKKLKKGYAFAVPLLAGLLVVAPYQGQAKSLEGKSLAKTPTIESKSDVKGVLKNLRGNVQAKLNAKQYKIVKTEKDNLGITHYTLKPTTGGYKANNAEIKIHTDKSGKTLFVNGDLNQKKLSLKNKVNISKNTAVASAFQAIGEKQSNVSSFSKQPVVKNAKLGIDANTNKLVYQVELSYSVPKVAHWLINVDAASGKISKKQNILSNAATTGSGTGLNGQTRSLHITKSGSTYSLVDQTHTGKVSTYDANNTYDNFTLVKSSTNKFTKQKQRAAVDAHYFAGQVYDYYLNTFNRDSYDNKGAEIVSYVHVSDPNASSNGVAWNNAAWTGSEMVYGDGDGKEFSPLSGAKDVIAHELTHAVTEKTAGLAYENQSGALNESFSDAFGYFNDSDDWLIGEDVYTPGKSGDALRSLSSPSTYGQPENMSEYVNSANTQAGDWGGVHTNSGIPNKAVYNTVKKIGKAKAEKIYYRALTYYLTSNAQFKDAKEALAQSAEDLYGSSEKASVEKAWEEVGVE